MATKAVSKPIPVRLRQSEDEILCSANRCTGIPQAEVIRRALRFMKKEAARQNGYAFLYDLTA